MRLSHFFIERPVFATVLSLILMIAGAIAQQSLPISEYPEIVPPTVNIKATYPGASAEVIAETVAAPIEQEVNGVDDMLYISSQSTGDGQLSINVVFKPGVNIDQAQVLVQNRLAVVQPRLPDEVTRFGITVRKSSPDLMMVVHMTSPDGSRDQQYIANYASLYIKDALLRIEGIGDVLVFGARDYSMRVWLDPAKVAERGLTAGEVVAALRAANLQVAAGAINQPPAKSPVAFQLAVQTLGRLSDPGQFENIMIRADADGGYVRLRDIARVELGSQDYTLNSYLNDNVATALVIRQRPGSNALATAATIKNTMEQLSGTFPSGVGYVIAYNPTEFIQLSIDEVKETLLIAVFLVALVVILFLQTWRAAVIPVLAIPISLFGSFLVMRATGIGLNTLSLFGLVLSIGIVVDDAIVVMENVERYLRQGCSPKEAAHKTMDEVGGALIAIALVLCAVFLPTAFISGLQGTFYKQFAITIAASTMISAFVSLTLSPALAAVLLKPHHDQPKAAGLWRFGAPVRWLFTKFNSMIAALSESYSWLTRRLIRISLIVLAIYGGLIALAYRQLSATPTGLIPQLDRGYLIAAFQLPPGASLDRTDGVIRDAIREIRQHPAVLDATAFVGFDGATFTNAPNTAAIFFTLKSFEERARRDFPAARIAAELRRHLSRFKDAFVIVLEPPSVPGIGTGGGLKGYVQNRTPINRVFEALSIYMGSTFVNDFNILGRTYRVTAQADNAYRLNLQDIANLKTRNASGEMVPIGATATFNDTTGPFRVPRYNLFPAAEVQLNLSRNFSSGQGIAAAERIAKERLPGGFAFEWTEITLQEKLAGNTAIVTFGLAVVFVFLLLAALYESWISPLAVVLIVPMCILAAMIGVNIRGLDRNILVDIGLVVLIGLAAKNAILIVEFAKQAETAGMGRLEAAVHAARTRMRPILMTSLAFIFGVLPLTVAVGAGAEMRQSLGTAVFAGMTGVTLFGLLFTPTFYTCARALADFLTRRSIRASRT